jgi:hypothetical protein
VIGGRAAEQAACSAEKSPQWHPFTHKTFRQENVTMTLQRRSLRYGIARDDPLITRGAGPDIGQDFGKANS